MRLHFILLDLLAIGTHAFFPALIQLGRRGLPANKFVLLPGSLPDISTVQTKLGVPTRALRIWDRKLVGSVTSKQHPYFVRHEETITWWETDLCIEAIGIESGQAVRINHCSGGPTQLWKFLPRENGRYQIQLIASKKCLSVDDAAGSNGALVELQECDDAATNSWQFEEAYLTSTQHALKRIVCSSLIWHVLISFFSMVALLVLSFGIWLWRWREKTGLPAFSEGRVPLGINHGGIYLTEPLPVHPHRIQAIRTPAWKELSQRRGHATMALNPIPVGGENSAVCSSGESDILASKPPYDKLVVQSSVVLTHHAAELRDRGFTVLPEAIDPSLVSAARADCSTEFERSLDSLAQLGIDPVKDRYAFSEIDRRHKLRWGIRPSGKSAWTQAIDAAVSVASPVIEELHRLPPHQDDVWLPELTGWARQLLPSSPVVEQVGAIISRPGAKAQRFHDDAGDVHFRYARLCTRHRLFNVFVPLVDLTVDGNDGTMMWPGSHLERTRYEAYHAAIARSKRLEDDTLAMSEMEVPACPVGGIYIVDFRLQHRGMPNETTRERTLAHAILSTGLAKDRLDFEGNSLQRAVDALPSDPQQRRAHAEAVARQQRDLWASIRDSSSA